MPTMTARGSLVSFAVALLLVGGPRPAAAPYPGFDAHIHYSRPDVDAPVVRRIAELAAERDLFLHAHVDADTIEKLLARYPKVRFLWAHAGMSADARTVGRLLDRFPKLWVELALRSDVAPGGRLDPEWRARFLRHADRFMVGTDTWVTSRWEAVESSTRDVQEWPAARPAEGG